MALDFEGEIYIRQEQRRDADGHLRAGVRAVVAARQRRGTSTWSCCRPTSTASRPRSRSPSSTTRPWRRPASSAIVNGPFTFAPDGNPLVGPVRGLRNCWVACAVMAGLSQGGGVGTGARHLDDRGRPRPRHLGHGRRPLRRLGHPRLHQRQGAGELQPPLPHHVPQRGAARRARPLHTTPVHDRLDRAQRGVGRRLRAGACAVVPAPGWASRSRTSRSAGPTPSRSWPRSAAPCASESGSPRRSNFAKYRVTGPGAGRVAAGPVHQPPAARSDESP